MKVPLLILVLILACGLSPIPANEAHPINSSSGIPFQTGVSDRELTAVQNELRQILEDKAPVNLSKGIVRENLKAAEKFYSNGDFMPVWWSGGGPTKQALMLLEVFRNAGNEGLTEDDYDTHNLQLLRAQVMQSQAPASASMVATFDLGMTLSALRYMSDMHRGRVDPRRAKWNVEPPPIDFDEAGFLRNRVISARNVSSALDELDPAFPGYRRTQSALQGYLMLAAEGEGESIPALHGVVHPGEAYAGVRPLAERLRRVGDFPPDQPLPGDGEPYGGALAKAVASFQQRHGLAANGILDAATIKEISVPFASRAVQLGLALERWRWLPANTRPPLIVVNIPEFELRAYEDQRLALAMPVIVGKAFKGRETPVFADQMEYLIFRPYWYVPKNITRKELAPRAARDDDYLRRNGFTIVDRQDNAMPVDQLDADVIKQLRSGDLQLRQTPGPENSLGLIKFVFPNDYSVYLHGTPETRLFLRARRDFSHGCIRVEDPVALALWVLRDDPSWDRERIESAMQAEAPQKVGLRKPLPVFILYSTAMVDENGTVRFFNDIYGLDAVLERLLAERPR